MVSMRQLLTLAITTVTALALASLPMIAANALQEGDSVDILIRTDQSQPQVPNNPQDGITFTGRLSGTVDISGCGAAVSRPVQQAVLVDREGGSGLIEVVVRSLAEPILAGTKITSFTATGICTIAADGFTYLSYDAIVARTR